MREFVTEVASLGRIRHRNLVELRGWCKRGEDLLLVYEFMPNGSLDFCFMCLIESTFSEIFRRVAKSVARIIALALNLDVDFFDTPEMLGEPIATLRLLHYEGGQRTGKVSNPVKGVFGAGAHSDYGLITLLATDDVVGLRICKDRNAQPQVWEYVAPVKGGFIVNLGDMLERWSNCIFRSTLHRVVPEGIVSSSFEDLPLVY